MIVESVFLALSLYALPAEASGTEQVPPTGRLVRFIGEQTAFDPIACVPYGPYGRGIKSESLNEGQINENMESSECHVDDLQFRARYRVIRALNGDAREAIEFSASAWTSYYANSRYALLYVLESPDGEFLPPGLAVSVYPAASGDWASCDSEEGSELVEFLGNPVFGRTGGMSPHGISQRFPPSDFVIVGDEVFCIRGRRLETLVKDLEYELQQKQGRGFPYLPGAIDPADVPHMPSAPAVH